MTGRKGNGRGGWQPTPRKLPEPVTIEGILEIDAARGVIYFHDAEKGITVLRICGLSLPADVESIDITHMVGAAVVRKDKGPEFSVRLECRSNG